MGDQSFFSYTDKLVFQSAFQLRELSQKKKEISQQIKAYRDDIAERRSYIEIITNNIRKLEAEIGLKNNNLLQIQSNVKSLRMTKDLLRQYEQTLKEDVERRKATYKHDVEAYEERIASYKETFRLHEEYHCQSPMAQHLLMLLADKQEIESRIKACDEEIALNQKELDHFYGPVVNSAAAEEQPDNVSGQQPLEEEKISPHAEEDGDYSLEISSLHLQDKQNVEVNAEEINEDNIIQDTPSSSAVPEEANEQLDERARQDERHSKEQDQERVSEDRVQEQQFPVEEAKEQEEEEEGVVFEENQAPGKEDEGLDAVRPSSSHEMNPPSPPVAVKATPSPPTFRFSFSPDSSPHQAASDNKCPAFPFSLNSDLSTPVFSGFRFDFGSSQDEESSFTFTESFFKEKETTESKSSGCPKFLFSQQDESDDFQFPFTATSPQTTNKKTGDHFPFSFNF
ncbi:protein SIX6OS1 [Antennarius striatus]|uniref:protein SIX6OS1 n=1 Tax=Antennarius striatus TaxID=241820 RepID=UPI0035B128E7